MKEYLLKLADTLDSFGYAKYADTVDAFIALAEDTSPAITPPGKPVGQIYKDDSGKICQKYIDGSGQLKSWCVDEVTTTGGNNKSYAERILEFFGINQIADAENNANSQVKTPQPNPPAPAPVTNKPK